MTILDMEFSLFSSLKEVTPHLKGSWICNLSLLALLPVDYRALRRKQHTLLSSFQIYFLLHLICQFWGKKKKHCTFKEQEEVSNPPSPPKTAASRLSICSPAALRNVLSHGASFAESFAPKPL